MFAHAQHAVYPNMRCGLSDHKQSQARQVVVYVSLLPSGSKLYSVTVCYTVTAVVSLNDYNWSVGCVFIICLRASSYW